MRTRNRPIAAALVIVGLVLAALAAGCGRSKASGGSRVVYRVIEDDPTARFAKTDLLEAVTQETWEFRTSADLEPWEPMLIDQRFEQRGIDLVIQSSKKRPRLLRSVTWQGEKVDAVELAVGGFSRGIGALYWAGPDGEFSDERRVVARRTDAVDPERMVFDVAFHPRWRGEIRRLRFQFESAQTHPIRLREVLVSRYRPIAEQVAAAAAHSWRIDLDHESRSGLLALPGLPVVRELEIPEHAVLRLGFGTGPGARLPMVFKAELEVQAGASHTLFEDLVAPNEVDDGAPPGDEMEGAGRWHDREIDLSGFAGSRATLRLTAQPATEAFELIRGLAYWSSPEIFAPADEVQPPNIVLISLDTLRADHLSLYGYDRETSPTLDRWAADRAAVFEQAIAPSPWTIPSHLSMLSGLDALSHGLNHSGAVGSGFDLLPERLKRAGYSTLAVTGGGFLHPDHGFSQGFDRYRYWPDARSEAELEAGVRQALDWVDEYSDRPFFLFFHTYEVHYPYRRREPFFTRFGGEQLASEPEIYLVVSDVPRQPEEGFLLSQKMVWKPEKKILKRSPVSDKELPEVVARYDSGVAFADLQLAPLLARLAQAGFAERTVVIITSDHGEALGERDLGGHAYLYDFNLRVPLIVSLPDGRGWGDRVDHQVGLVDLLPTVLEVAGLEIPSDLDGASLLPLINGVGEASSREAWSYAAFSNRGVALRVDNRLKYLFNNTAWEPLTGQEELYDLRQDPAEDVDLSTARDTSALRRRMVERLAATAATRFQVRFENASDRPFRGQIRGGAIHPAIVKAADVPAGALTWNEVGSADFRLLPGERFTLVLERVEGRWLKLKGAMDATKEVATAPFEEALGVEGFEGDWGMVWAGDRWESGMLSGLPPDVMTGVLVSKRPGSGRESFGEPEIDAELVQQLRALGYVD